MQCSKVPTERDHQRSNYRVTWAVSMYVKTFLLIKSALPLLNHKVWRALFFESCVCIYKLIYLAGFACRGTNYVISFIHEKGESHHLSYFCRDKETNFHDQTSMMCNLPAQLVLRCIGGWMYVNMCLLLHTLLVDLTKIFLLCIIISTTYLLFVCGWVTFLEMDEYEEKIEL